MCIHLHTLAHIPVLTTHVHTYSHVTPPPRLHTHIYICGPPYLTYALTRTHMLTNTGMYTHTYACTNLCPHVHGAHIHTLKMCVQREMCAHTHPTPRLANEQKNPASGRSLFKDGDCALQRWGLCGLPRLTLCWLFSLFSFFGFFVVPSVPETYFLSKDSNPCCWAQCWADPGADRPQCPSVSSPAWPALAHVRPPTSPNLDMTSFPPCTCHFKSPEAWWACPQGWAEGGWTAAGWGEALLAPRGLLEPRQCWGNRNKDRQWPPSLPGRPRSRACMGGLWGPLLFPVLAAGLLASRKWAGSGAGHLLPTRWAGPHRPE